MHNFPNTRSIQYYIDNLTAYYDNDSERNFSGVSIPWKLDQKGKERLSNLLHLDIIIGTKKKLVLHKVIEEKKYNFLLYLLSTTELTLIVNSLDGEGKSIFQKIANLFFDEKENFSPGIFDNLFQHGYTLKTADKEYVTQLYSQIKTQNQLVNWSLLRFLVLAEERKNIEIVLQHQRELYIILAVKMGKPIYFNFPNILGMVNHGLIYCRECGDIILKSLKMFNRQEKIDKLDSRKGNFRRLKMDFMENKPIQNKEFEKLAEKIFPELSAG